METEVDATGNLRPTGTALLPQTKKMAEIVEMGLKATIRLTEMDEGGDKKNRFGMQIAYHNLVISAKALKKWMHSNSETALEKNL